MSQIADYYKLNEYSIIVDFIIVILDGGDISTLVFEKITEGDELDV